MHISNGLTSSSSRFWSISCLVSTPWFPTRPRNPRKRWGFLQWSWLKDPITMVHQVLGENGHSARLAWHKSDGYYRPKAYTWWMDEWPAATNINQQQTHQPHPNTRKQFCCIGITQKYPSGCISPPLTRKNMFFGARSPDDNDQIFQDSNFPGKKGRSGVAG